MANYSDNNVLTLVTLDKLNPINTINGIDLLYVQQFDNTSTTYKEIANKITFDNFRTSLGFKTAVNYDAGLSPNNVLLIPLSGKIPQNVLDIDKASSTTFGIIKGSANIPCTNGIADLANVVNLEGINLKKSTNTLSFTFDASNNAVINTTSKIKITCNELSVNDIPFGNSKNGKIINITNYYSSGIDLNPNDGINPYYYITTKLGGSEMIRIISNKLTSLTEVFSFNIIFKISYNSLVIFDFANASINNFELNTHTEPGDKTYILNFNCIPQNIIYPSQQYFNCNLISVI